MKENLFKWKHFESHIIILCVRWKLKYPLSYRNLEEIYYGVLSCNVQHRMIRYLNNIVEQDHRFIRRIIKPMLGFKNFYSACRTISGIESMHMIRKGQAGTKNVLKDIELINKLFNVA